MSKQAIKGSLVQRQVDQLPSSVKTTVSILEAQNGWVESVESTLDFMLKSKDNPKALAEGREILKKVLKQAHDVTTEALLKGNSGATGNGVLISDPVGWTTNKTAWSRPQSISKNPYCALVSEIISEIKVEEEKDIIDQGGVVTPSSILAAQLDSLDDTKEEIELKGSETPSGEKTDLIINKETGDTVVVQKDAKGNIITRTFKSFWKNIKNFCETVWKYVSKTWLNFVDWVKSFFKVPEDQEIILAHASS